MVTPHIDAQLDDGLDARLLSCVVPRAAVPDLDRAATILLWAGDLKEELPVLYLRVRRAVTELGATLVVVHPRRTGLHDVADITISYRPGEGPDVLAALVSGPADDGPVAAAREALARGPVVAIVGRTGRAEDPRLAEAVAAFARDLPQASLLPVTRRANVYGAFDMGLAPDLLPGRVSVDNVAGAARLEDAWGPLPRDPGLGATDILEGLRSGEIEAVVLVGCDPVRDHPQPALATAALESAGFVVAFDLFLSDSALLADVVLPVEGFAETEGTVTNLEGRVQKVNRIVAGPGLSRPTWSVLDDLSVRMGGELGAPSAEAIMKEIALVAPVYAGISWDLLDWGPGREGVVVPLPDVEQPLEYVPVDPGLESTSGRWALHLARTLYDDGVLTRMSPAIGALAAEAAAYLNPDDADALDVSRGSVLDVRAEGGSVELVVRLDPTLAAGTVYVPANLAGTAALGASSTVDLVVRKGAGA